ncbi:MAG TPA: transposase [Anaerohalosphaeraceae bacterium]|nr:transposase [Anaerohalosphaeraceae bacterium]HQI08398.1 transposase [Anaerohalosphaeraceae bacterium]
MKSDTDTNKALLRAARFFAKSDACEELMRAIKWYGGEPVCPTCGSGRIGAVQTRHLMRCRDCRKQFSSRAGTPFEDSPIGLDKWFVAVWALANVKDGIRSSELSRTIGVSQRTAWFMLKRIRVAMGCAGVDRLDNTSNSLTIMTGRRPKGFADFADLLRRVASVPKEQLDAKIAADRAEKKNRCKKNKLSISS